MANGTELDEVMVSREVLGKENEMIAPEPELTPDNWFYRGEFLCGLKKLRNACEGAVVRDSKCRHAQSVGLFKEVAYIRQPVRRILCVNM